MGNTLCVFVGMKCSHTGTLGPIDSQNWWAAMVTMSLNSLRTRNLFGYCVLQPWGGVGTFSGYCDLQPWKGVRTSFGVLWLRRGLGTSPRGLWPASPERRGLWPPYQARLVIHSFMAFSSTGLLWEYFIPNPLPHIIVVFSFLMGWEHQVPYLKIL